MQARPRIVLIEDNAADVLLVREAIAQSGIVFELVCYSDVPDAIAGLCDDSAPAADLILVDLNLPRGEGLAVVQALRGSTRLRQAPLAVLTSSQSPRDRELAEQFEITRYIHKPSTLDEFIREIGGAVKIMLADRQPG